MFLFQIGAIKTQLATMNLSVKFLSFYSRLVRLKLTYTQLQAAASNMFLFQIGAIKTSIKNLIQYTDITFLFQIGAIKTCWKGVPKE